MSLSDTLGGVIDAPPMITRGSSADGARGVELGLTDEEARARLAKWGPNDVTEAALRPWRAALARFWAPVPWMLEGAIVLQLVLHDFVEAAVVTGLLAFNAIVGFLQEGRARATLAALKSRLALTATVRRDGRWKNVPAAELVPGDVMRLSVGGVVAADATVSFGSILLDQSMLTGESAAVEAGAGTKAFAGALVRRGDATATVTQTGARTEFGHTAELVRTAHVESTQQHTVIRVVRNLALCNGVIILLLAAYALLRHLPLREVIPLLLTAVLASIPVALPATFTLAAALGARALARLGVLSTRLSAVDEAATLDVLCSDKTGTLTLNQLTLTAIRPLADFDAGRVLALATLASADGGQDPVDSAIRSAYTQEHVGHLPRVTRFVPFDSATKLCEATAVDESGTVLRAVKGAFDSVVRLSEPQPSAAAAAVELEDKGFRVLAVAVAVGASPLRLAGLIALSDPPRADAAATLEALKALGVRTLMVTGDAPRTAAIVAREVGLNGPVCPPGPIPARVRSDAFAVFAGVLPEGKYLLVKALQKGGHTVGMCGDGANDAPALRQAQMGIAVSTATDVAKSAAGIVLTQPGLEGVVAAVRQGRLTFQRILTYTLNSVTKKIVQVLFLAAGLLMTGHAILTPMLMVLIMITGDFLGMSLTTDNVRPSPQPSAWRVGALTLGGVLMGLSELLLCTAVLAVGKYSLGLSAEALRTLAFVVIVFGNQATTYTNRTRGHLWSVRPSSWLVLSSVVDVAIAWTMALCGLAMAPLPWAVVGGTMAGAVLFASLADLVKVPVFRHLRIA